MQTDTHPNFAHNNSLFQRSHDEIIHASPNTSCFWSMLLWKLMMQVASNIHRMFCYSILRNYLCWLQTLKCVDVWLFPSITLYVEITEMAGWRWHTLETERMWMVWPEDVKIVGTQLTQYLAAVSRVLVLWYSVYLGLWSYTPPCQ